MEHLKSLKPCYNCGSDRVAVIASIYGVSVLCLDCDTEVSDFSKTAYSCIADARIIHREKAIEKWNRRANEQKGKG